MAELYRTIMTLKVGAEEEIRHVHKELLVKKSSVVAAYFEPVKEYNDIHESLKSAKALLQDSATADGTEVEDVSWFCLLPFDVSILLLGSLAGPTCEAVSAIIDIDAQSLELRLYYPTLMAYFLISLWRNDW